MAEKCLREGYKGGYKLGYNAGKNNLPYDDTFPEGKI